jgi:hypothetical protein
MVPFSRDLGRVAFRYPVVAVEGPSKLKTKDPDDWSKLRFEIEELVVTATG